MSEENTGVTQPLGFKRFLRDQPKQGFDAVPFLDLLIILMLIGMNFSKFIMTPGAVIELARTEVNESAVEAPTAVLTVGRNELYFFEGYKVSPSALESHLNSYIQDLHNPQEMVLLIKADKHLNAEILFGLFESARKAGFSHVQLAAELSDSFRSSWKEQAKGFEN